MARVAVVYHSGFGHTKVVAESIGRGVAAVDGVEALVISSEELPTPGSDRVFAEKWAELDGADAIVFGCPTYMGSVSAEFKRFMEAASGKWFTQAWKDKIAAGFTNGGGMSGDKGNCMQDLMAFACQQGMVWVSLGIMPPSKESKLNRLGSSSGLETQADNGPAEVTPPAEDHETAEVFGKRISAAVLRWG